MSDVGHCPSSDRAGFFSPGTRNTEFTVPACNLYCCRRLLVKQELGRFIGQVNIPVAYYASVSEHLFSRANRPIEPLCPVPSWRLQLSPQTASSRCGSTSNSGALSTPIYSACNGRSFARIVEGGSRQEETVTCRVVDGVQRQSRLLSLFRPMSSGSTAGPWLPFAHRFHHFRYGSSQTHPDMSLLSSAFVWPVHWARHQ